MKTLNDFLKSRIKKFLLFLLRKIENDGPQSPIIRLSTKNIFKKEINIHPYVILAVTFCVLFFMLVMQIGASYSAAAGVFILLSLMFTFLIIHVKDKEKKTMEDFDIVMLMSFVFICSLFLFQIFQATISPIAFPMAAFTVMLAILVSARTGFIYAFTMSIIISILSNFDASVSIIQVCGSLVGLVGIKKIRSRSEFTSVGFKVAAVMSVMLLVLYLFDIYSLKQAELNIWFALLSGFISVLIILAILPFLESIFSRTTNIKLIELADFNKPLLKKLMMEAPGTYHHSLITASLAEQAAEAIGSNALLARVCAYYHDIGKLKNPEYFIENQNQNANPHDGLTPSMSGLVLISHVKDGVALAKKYKIDKVIVDSINEHHGTSLIQYFYHRALEQNMEVNEEDFRYPGKKPRTKVSAILMIADSIEAISRTIKEPNAGKLKEVVEKVINNKFTDGQFSECPMTLADLVKIAESMTATLCGIYHARIEYKQIEKK